MSDQSCPFIEISDHNRIVATLRADLAVALERVGELEELLEHAEENGGMIVAERDQLKRERDEAIAYQGEHRQAAIDGGYIKGFEDCREAAVKVCNERSATMGSLQCQYAADDIRALTVPERDGGVE